MRLQPLGHLSSENLRTEYLEKCFSSRSATVAHLGLIILWGTATTAQIGRWLDSGTCRLPSGIFLEHEEPRAGQLTPQKLSYRKKLYTLRWSVDHFLQTRFVAVVTGASCGSSRGDGTSATGIRNAEFSWARSPLAPTRSYRLLRGSLGWIVGSSRGAPTE